MIYATADLHGFPLSRFKALLEKAGFCDDDFLFVLGDVVDRGTDGIALLRWMMCRPNVELILGNHEAFMLENEFLLQEITDSSLQSVTYEQLDSLADWIANGGEPTIAALQRLSVEERKYIYEYLHEAPLYETVSTGNGQFLLTHSGLDNFSADKRPDAYEREDLLWNRPLLTDEYYPHIMTVFGHTPTIYYGEKYSGKCIRTKTWIDIDTGAGWGYSPMLLCLDNLNEYYL